MKVVYILEENRSPKVIIIIKKKYPTRKRKEAKDHDS